MREHLGHTPNISDVRFAYSERQFALARSSHVKPLSDAEYAAEFDRWLDLVRADAWDEGHHAGVLNVTGPYDLDPVDNPYRRSL